MTDTVAAQPARRPYRWGRFQGWALIFISLIQFAMTMLLLYRPNYRPQNGVAVGYFKEFLWRHAGTNGALLAAFYAFTFVIGVSILKKRMLLFLFLALVIIGAAIEFQWAQLAFWIASAVYYAKRRREFSWP
jgi:hypothetical protein